MSEFSKTEHLQKTPVRIANEGQRTGATASTHQVKNSQVYKRIENVNIMLKRFDRSSNIFSNIDRNLLKLLR